MIGQREVQKKISKKIKDDKIEFIKQVPVHPRDRSAQNSKKRSKKIKKDNEVEFIKQTPVHPPDRLREK